MSRLTWIVWVSVALRRTIKLLVFTVQRLYRPWCSSLIDCKNKEIKNVKMIAKKLL